MADKKTEVTEEHRQLPLFELDDANIEKQKQHSQDSPLEETEFGKYIVYVDESGDHSLQSIDKHYPVFVLAFCVFHKRHYSEAIVPALEKFKFNHFGHDQVILHENEIRKQKGVFTSLIGREKRGVFMEELNQIIEFSNFILISTVIDKYALSKQGVEGNAYHFALGHCMETLYELLMEKNQESKKTHVVVECRGKKEDAELELEFRRVCDGNNRFGTILPFDILFSDKKAMSTGLQLADLVARPIGLSKLKPAQPNRAFETLKMKFYCDEGRAGAGSGYEGAGLKIFPAAKSEKPR